MAYVGEADKVVRNALKSMERTLNVESANCKPLAMVMVPCFVANPFVKLVCVAYVEAADEVVRNALKSMERTLEAESANCDPVAIDSVPCFVANPFVKLVCVAYIDATSAVFAYGRRALVTKG